MQDKYKTNCVYVTFYSFGGNRKEAERNSRPLTYAFSAEFWHKVCMPFTLFAEHLACSSSTLLMLVPSRRHAIMGERCLVQC